MFKDGCKLQEVGSPSGKGFVEYLHKTIEFGRSNSQMDRTDFYGSVQMDELYIMENDTDDQFAKNFYIHYFK